MTNQTCCVCGIIYGVPEVWIAARRELKDRFYCPNGHGQCFTKSTADRLREEKEALGRRLQAELNTANHLRLVAEKELKAERTKRRKIEKRISAGVCPCCNRTFEDLHRHMQTKHKEYALPPAAAGVIQASKVVIQ